MMLAVLAVVGGALQGFSQPDILAHAADLEKQGRFKEAELAIDLALEKTQPADKLGSELAWEKERLRRVRLDYPLTERELYEELRKSVAHLTREEFQTWVQQGRFDARPIDGTERYMVASASNLFFRYPELNSRRLPPRNSAALDSHYLEVCTRIKAEALAQKTPYVMPKQFQVSMTVTADPDAAPPGSRVRAWLPIPRQTPFQTGFDLVSSTPPGVHTDAPESAARSAYLEATAQKGKPTQFNVQYNYSTKGVWFDLKPERTQTANPNDPAVKSFTQETEHVRFTPELRALAQRIAAEETNPCVQAKKFYDWIAANIQYSFATEYSTIPNISEYCQTHGYGDCGQEGMLFITLCRLRGIPARWESGWTIFPGAKANHDWTEIYLEPYGWVPVDPYMGIYATRYATSLTAAQRAELRDFYFGGLDPWRLIANADHCQPLVPPKNSVRSDNVDFQRGELEANGQNIYFDHFTYDLSAKEVSSPPRVE